MTGHGKRGKPRTGFPSFPTALGNRCAIPTFPQPRQRPRGKVEIQKQDSHFPVAACCLVTNLGKEDSPECRLRRPSGSSSIRKCLVSIGYSVGGRCFIWLKVVGTHSNPPLE